MPDVRCSNCNTLLQPRHYEKGKCFNCDNSIKDYEKVLLKNEGKSLKKMLLSISSIVVILFLYGFISIYGSSIKESISSFFAKSSSSSISNKIYMCRCLTEPENSEWSRDNENNCDRSINDYLGFNWKSTNFSLQKNKSKQEKWEQLTSQCTSSSSSSTNKSSSSSSSRKSENTDYEKKVCQDPYGNWHSHISTCTTCGTSYCVEYLQYGKYCSQGCCAMYEGRLSKCGY